MWVLQVLYFFSNFEPIIGLDILLIVCFWRKGTTFTMFEGFIVARKVCRWHRQSTEGRNSTYFATASLVLLICSFPLSSSSSYPSSSPSSFIFLLFLPSHFPDTPLLTVMFHSLIPSYSPTFSSFLSRLAVIHQFGSHIVLFLLLSVFLELINILLRGTSGCLDPAASYSTKTQTTTLIIKSYEAVCVCVLCFESAAKLVSGSYSPALFPDLNKKSNQSLQPTQS